jgi:hypothetical protein
MSKNSSKTETTEQYRRFVEATRQFGADERQQQLEDKLRRITSVRPKPKKTKPKQ